MANRPSTPCPVCGGSLPRRARTGRPAVYCSRACQAKAYRARVGTRCAAATPRITATEPAAAVLPSTAATNDAAADRIDRLTVALVRRAEVAAGAVRTGRPLPDGSGGIDGRPDAIEQIARELVATIRGAALEAEASHRDETLAAAQPPVVVPAPSTRHRAPAAVAASREPAERVTQTVDMSHEFGDGYALVQLESSFDGEWLVRLHGETIGSVQRVASLSGHSARGWEARHHGLTIPRMVRGDWPSRGLAMAAIVYAHGQHCLKARRRPRRRLQGA